MTLLAPLPHDVLPPLPALCAGGCRLPRHGPGPACSCITRLRPHIHPRPGRRRRAPRRSAACASCVMASHSSRIISLNLLLLDREQQGRTKGRVGRVEESSLWYCGPPASTQQIGHRRCDGYARTYPGRQEGCRPARHALYPMPAHNRLPPILQLLGTLPNKITQLHTHNRHCPHGIRPQTPARQTRRHAPT